MATTKPTGGLAAVSGTIFNTVGAASAIVSNVRSLFGETDENLGSNKGAINNLRSYLAKNDIMSTNMFYVSLQPPAMLAKSGQQMASDLSLLCHQASLPGVSLNTSEIRRYGTGATEKKPTFPIFTDMTLTFLGDGKGDVRNYFYNWINGIVRFTEPGGSLIEKSYAPFEVAYKADYAVTMDIVVLDRYNRKIFVTHINEAYPIALGDVSLSWHDNDSIMNIPVTFTYYNWKAEAIDVGSIIAGEDPTLSTLGKLVKLGTAIQTLSMIKKPRSIGDVVNVTKNAASSVNGIRGLF